MSALLAPRLPQRVLAPTGSPVPRPAAATLDLAALCAFVEQELARWGHTVTAATRERIDGAIDEALAADLRQEPAPMQAAEQALRTHYGQALVEASHTLTRARQLQTVDLEAQAAAVEPDDVPPVRLAPEFIAPITALTAPPPGRRLAS